MRSLVLGVLALFAMLLPAVAMAQGKVTSMLPAEPQVITVVDEFGTCTQEKMYFVGVLFQMFGESPTMQRLAEQAAASYGDPKNLIVFEEDKHRFMRALEIRDYSGLKRFLTSLKGDNAEMDVMVVAIPTDKRFASVDEQIRAWKEVYIKEVVELGAKPC